MSFSLAAIPARAQQISASNMKWNPGHYIMNDLSRSTLEKIIIDFKNITAVRGILRTYYWSQIETSKGVYNYSEIEADLALARKYKKKLALMIGYKYQASKTQSSLPQYILKLEKAPVNGLLVPAFYVQGKAGDGQYNSGHHANFGHPKTLENFALLLNKLATRYDANPDIAYIQFIETSSGATLTAAQDANFLNGIMNMEKAARAAFDKTPLFQSLNFPRQKHPSFMNHLTNLKMGFGGPDTFTGSFDAGPENGLAYRVKPKYANSPYYPGIYLYHEPNYIAASNKNKLPISMQAHTGSMVYKTRDDELAKRKSFNPTQGVNAVYNFARNTLRVNYLTWQIFGEQDANRVALKQKLQAEQLANPNGLGGVIKTCPTIYTSCAADAL